jgi:NADH:ubiquinone reductase (H+-translocating)
MRPILVVGGGYAGFYTAWKLERKPRRATQRGKTKRYVHHSLGVVATLGLGRGIFQYRRIVIRGSPAWLMHRGYHVLAVPSWERKIRVLAVWLTAAVSSRDIVSLTAAPPVRFGHARSA